MKHVPILTVFLFSLSSFAQNSLPPIATEIVVTASALEEPVESAPAAVTVLTREEIEQRQARDIADLLREVPGLQLARTGAAGKVTSLFTRGGNSGHTLVLWNGIELNNPYFSGYDWGRFSTAGVEQVEIVRGPYSARYGSHAVSGVIHVLTAPAGSGFELNAQAGERGLLNGVASGSWAAGDLGVSGTVESRTDDGWNRNDDFSQETAQAGVRWKRANLSIGLEGRFSSYDLGIPFSSSDDGTALVPSPRRRQDGNELQVNLPVRLDVHGIVYELSLSRVERDDDFQDPDDPFGFTSSTTEASTSRVRASVRAGTSVGTVIAGGEYETAEVDAGSNFGTSLDNHQRTGKSLFIEDRLSRAVSRGRVELSLGVRADEFDTFGTEVSPRVGAAYISGRNKVRAAYGEGFRAPSIGELYFPFSGNAALRSEKSRSAEVGFDRFLARSGSVSVTFFQSDFEELITFDLQSFQFQNISEASTRGMELSGETPSGNAWSGGFSYTYLHAEEGGGEPLLRRPRHSGSLRLSYDRPIGGATLVVTHSGERPDLFPVVPFSVTTNQAFTVADLNARFVWRALEPYIKIENLTNEDYEEVLGYRSPRRRAIAGVRYRWKS